MDNFYDYIKERSSKGGCNVNKWDCEKYLDCDICLQDKIAEHEKQIKAEAFDEFKQGFYEFAHYEPCSMKFEVYQEDLLHFIENLKEQNP